MTALEKRIEERREAITGEPTAPDTAIAVREQPSNLATHSQIQLSRENLELLKRTLAADANLTDAELQLFSEVASRKGLDPFAGQIHAVKRMGRLNFQTGIDGFRLIAQRTGLYAGQDAPQWCGEDAVWRDIWPSKNAPVAAKVSVYRTGWAKPVTVIAHYHEYVQTTKEGSPNRIWKERAAAQLAKCAEALAIRKAFPEALSGLYTTEEMAQADNPTPPIDVSATAVQPATASDYSPAPPEVLEAIRNAIALLSQEAKVQLAAWWKSGAVQHRADALSTAEAEIVTAKILELKGDGGPDDDTPVEGEIVEDSPGSSGIELLKVVRRERDLTPPECNALAGFILHKVVKRIDTLTDDEARNVAEQIEQADDEALAALLAEATS